MKTTHSEAVTLDRPLTPEEDTLGDPEEAEEEVSDFLPADLWV